MLLHISLTLGSLSQHCLSQSESCHRCIQRVHIMAPKCFWEMIQRVLLGQGVFCWGMRALRPSSTEKDPGLQSVQAVEDPAAREPGECYPRTPFPHYPLEHEVDANVPRSARAPIQAKVIPICTYAGRNGGQASLVRGNSSAGSFSISFKVCTCIFTSWTSSTSCSA